MSLLSKPILRAATFIEVLAEDFPMVQASAEGDGNDYELLRASLDGDPLPSLEVLTAKRHAKTQSMMWRWIQEERDVRKYNGVKVGANWFHSDNPSRIQQIGLVMMGASLPAIQWKTLSTGFVVMSQTMAMQIFQATAAQDVAIFTRAEQHRYFMMQSTNPSTYDFSTGWPPTFEGTI